MVETVPDPADGRRTLVRLTGRARRAASARTKRITDETIARAIADPGRAERIIALLDELAGLLLPPTTGSPRG